MTTPIRLPGGGAGLTNWAKKGVILGTVDKGKMRPAVCAGRKAPIQNMACGFDRSDSDVREAVISALPENSSRDIYRLVLTG